MCTWVWFLLLCAVLFSLVATHITGCCLPSYQNFVPSHCHHLPSHCQCLPSLWHHYLSVITVSRSLTAKNSKLAANLNTNHPTSKNKNWFTIKLCEGVLLHGNHGNPLHMQMSMEIISALMNSFSFVCSCVYIELLQVNSNIFVNIS